MKGDLLVYKEIPDHPNYEIDEFGHVRNKRTGRVSNSKERVWLGTGIKYYYISQLVAETFLDPPPKDGQTYRLIHLNNDSQDNRASNLCWMSNSEFQYKLYADGRNRRFNF